MILSSIARPRRRVTRLLGLLAVALIAAGAALAGPAPSADAHPWDQGPGAEASPAVARLCGSCADELLVVRAFTGELYYSLPTVYEHSNPPITRTGTWLRIPGAVMSPYAPAVTHFSGSTLYVVAVGPNGKGIYTQAYHADTYQWEPAWLVPGSESSWFSAGPAATSSLGYLWLFAPTTDHHLRYNAWSPAGNWWFWSTWADAGFTTRKAVGAAPSAGGVRLVARGEDRRIYQSAVGWGWAPWTEIPGGGLTDQQPALSQTYTAPDTHTVLVTGIDGRTAYQVLVEGKTSTGWRLTPAPMVTPFGPALNGWGTTRLYATGADGGIYVHVAKVQGSPYGLVNASETFTTWRLMTPVTPTTPPPPPPGGGGGTTSPQWYPYCVKFSTSTGVTHQDHSEYTSSLADGYQRTVDWANATKPPSAIVNVYHGTCAANGFPT